MLFLLASPVLGQGTAPFLTDQDGTQTLQFGLDDKVYIEGVCTPASGGSSVKIYITYDKVWNAGDALSDVAGGAETISMFGGPEIPRTIIWPQLYAGAFDIVMDTNNDLILQEYEKSCIIGVDGAGFRVGIQPPPPPPPPPPVVTPPPAAPPPTTSSTTTSSSVTSAGVLPGPKSKLPQ